MPTLATAYKTILDSVEYDALPQEEQEKFLAELDSLIFRGTVVRMLEHMDESTKRSWYKLMEKGASDEELQRFLERRAPKAELALAETVETLAGDILAATT